MQRLMLYTNTIARNWYAIKHQMVTKNRTANVRPI